MKQLRRAAGKQRAQHLRLLRIARSENDRNGRIDSANLLERVGAAQPGHHHVQHQQRNLLRIGLEFFDRVAPVPREYDRISQTSKHLLRHLAQAFVVFCEKNGLGSPTNRRFLDIRTSFGGIFAYRQINAEDAAFASLTIDIDVS